MQSTGLGIGLTPQLRHQVFVRFLSCQNMLLQDTLALQRCCLSSILPSHLSPCVLLKVQLQPGLPDGLLCCLHLLRQPPSLLLLSLLPLSPHDCGRDVPGALLAHGLC